MQYGLDFRLGDMNLLCIPHGSQDSECWSTGRTSSQRFLYVSSEAFQSLMQRCTRWNRRIETCSDPRCCTYGFRRYQSDFRLPILRTTSLILKKTGSWLMTSFSTKCASRILPVFRGKILVESRTRAAALAWHDWDTHISRILILFMRLCVKFRKFAKLNVLRDIFYRVNDASRQSQFFLCFWWEDTKNRINQRLLLWWSKMWCCKSGVYSQEWCAT